MKLGKTLIALLLVITMPLCAWGQTSVPRDVSPRDKSPTLPTNNNYHTGTTAAISSIGAAAPGGITLQKWASDTDSFHAALSAIGSAKAILHLAAATYNISDDLTVPPNIVLTLERGARFALATSKTLTINRGIEAGPDKIFSCTGTGKVVLNNQTIYPQWFGAVCSSDSSSTSQSTYIDQAVTCLMNSANAVLDFGTGQYIIDSPIYISSTSGKSGFAVKGNNAIIKIKDNTPYIVPGLGTNKPLAYSNIKDRQFSNIEVQNCSDFSIKGLIVDGNYPNRGISTLEHSYGINLAGCHNFVIDGIQARYCQGDGICLSAMDHKSFSGHGTTTSNCSDFNIINISAKYCARNGISFVGAQNGNLSNLVGYGIGGDTSNYAIKGPWRTVHFEVDPSEIAYEVCKNISVENVTSSNGRIHGGLLGVSYAATDITFNNFKHTDTNASTVSHNIIVVGYNNTNIKLSNGSIQKTNSGGTYARTYGIYVQSGADSLSTVEIQNVTIDGCDVSVRHDTNTQLKISGCCKFVNWNIVDIESYGKLSRISEYE